MVIGLTIVALGTSAPEIFVSAISSLENQPQLAVGNALGSNIANVGMVLGTTALFMPLKVRVDVLRSDIPIMVFVTLCAGAALIDHQLGFWDGVLLLTGLALFLFRLAREQRRASGMELAAEIEELEDIPAMSNVRAVGTFLVALFFLLAASELLVWAVANIAQMLGISELLIGLTVIAVGTSLPELVVSITSAMKAQTDIAIGNIVGSNIFNILAVLSIPCIIAPTSVEPSVLWRDYATMLLLTALLVVFAYWRSPGASIGRGRGVLLIGIWSGYLIMLYYAATGAPLT